MPERTFLIVGASLAELLRQRRFGSTGFDGRVILTGEESHAPYERPLLSKGYLPEDRGFIAFYVNAGVISAAVGMNRGEQIREATLLIKARASVDELSEKVGHA